MSLNFITYKGHSRPVKEVIRLKAEEASQKVVEVEKKETKKAIKK